MGYHIDQVQHRNIRQAFMDCCVSLMTSARVRGNTDVHTRPVRTINQEQNATETLTCTRSDASFAPVPSDVDDDESSVPSAFLGEEPHDPIPPPSAMKKFTVTHAPELNEEALQDVETYQA